MRLNLAPHTYPGSLVVICGPDGSGKTTLENGLLTRLAEHAVTPDVIMQPTNWWRQDPGVVARMVADPDGLSPMAMALFALADRFEQQEKVIEPALRAGRCVVSNRYVLSLMAHYLTTREIELDPLVALTGRIVKPDLLVVMDAPGSVLLERVIGRDGADSRRWDQRADFVTRNREAFRTLALDNDGLLLSSEERPEVLVDAVWSRVEPLLSTALVRDAGRGTRGAVVTKPESSRGSR